MLDYSAVNWGKLARPSPLFRVFSEPTEAQMAEIVGRLKDDYLYAPDELRDEETLRALVWHYWGSGRNIIYEVGEFRGILGFMDIVPEHKSNVTLKLWGRETWGRNFVREARALMSLVMDEFRLTRLATETPDPRVVTMARLAGMTTEGVRPRDFKWDGKYYDTTVMGLVNL